MHTEFCMISIHKVINKMSEFRQNVIFLFSQNVIKIFLTVKNSLVKTC